jgi:hypothetical protein
VIETEAPFPHSAAEALCDQRIGPIQNVLGAGFPELVAVANV